MGQDKSDFREISVGRFRDKAAPLKMVAEFNDFPEATYPTVGMTSYRSDMIRVCTVILQHIMRGISQTRTEMVG